MAVTAEDIRAELQQAFATHRVQVKDDSARHAGHAGMQGKKAEGTHFEVRIISAAFEGVSRVARHRLVYQALDTYIQNGVHALAIEAHTPQEKAD